MVLSSVLINKKTCIKTGIFVSIGVIVSLLSVNLSEKHYDSMLPDRNCGAIVLAEVNDTTCSSSEESEWMSQPYLLKVKVRKFKYSKSDEWKETEGISDVILPKDCPRIGYGDTIHMEGAFILPKPPIFKGDYDFKRYLLSNKIRRIYEARACEVIRKPGRYNIYHKILVFRDFLMNKSVKGMENLENKKITAAIVFGCRQGLSMEDRKNFTRSGTIHVFSISGLHVGIIAVMLFWMFKWLPFRLRHLIIPIAIFIYVFTTGMTPPAVRAFLMIGVWCIQRAFLYPSSSLNSVFLAAAIILFFNPFSILDIGFQFSFIVAGFLVLSWNNSERWISSLLEKSRWIPNLGGFAYLTFKNRFTVNLARSIMTSFIAWLAGAGLSLIYQGLFIPVSILVNFAIIPFVSLFFASIIFKLIFSPLWILANYANYPVELSLDIIKKASEIGADFGTLCLARPSLIAVIVFYTFLVILVVTERRRYFLVSASVIVLIISIWLHKGISSSGSIYVLHGGQSQEPVVAICPPGNTRSLLVNSGSSDTARSIINLLTVKGVDSTDTLLVCEARREFCEASSRLIAGKNIRHLMISDKFRKSWFSKKAVEAAVASGCETSLISITAGEFHCKDGVSFSIKKNGNYSDDYHIGYVIPELNLHIRIINSMPGLKRIEMRTSDSNNIVLENMNTNIPCLKEIQL
ncbi:MAG: hypothetical protein A2X48_18095 [Lentisphaerae bacterium GWF2_49_21]|nr:MAG: hypothetical protein A2X48_18095 [Lentisphaerae bacterium GWF2_49_21]